MKTKLISHGRGGVFQLQPKKFYWGFEESFSVEPWRGIYYVFHGLCLPLIFETIVSDYRSHRVRASIWNLQKASQLWHETGDLWRPVIDWVNENNFEHNIGFRFNKFQIQWYWNTQFGDSKELNAYRIKGLTERFEILGSGLKKRLNICDISY